MYKPKCRSVIRLIACTIVFLPLSVMAQVDYSVLKVNEESGLHFTKITNDNDYVCMPEVRRNGKKLNWLTNRIIDIAKDNNHLAYLSGRNNTTNIFIKEIDKQGASVQRTNRTAVLDFSYSPDGKYICFSEGSGKLNQIYQTSANEGYVCRQFTSGNKDYTPVYSSDMSCVFFSRMENNGASVWSYNIGSNFLSSYASGFNPCPAGKENILLCTRMNTEGRGEIWRVNYNTGVEECVVSDPQRSFTTPSISPDGQWILFVGSNVLHNGKAEYANTDIFACKTDGTNMVQLTFHAADDLSPVWSKDGHFIYFISQRGSATGTANVWRMNFAH
ncbi:MAG: PD40 domain-containing protein [Prevotella sp.]|nr:PD40 domain-containing protein [Prevotella sp.]